MCEALAKEQMRDPSREWNGCAWPVLIINSHATVVGLLAYHTRITVVPSYRDSEKLDVTVTFEKPHCGSGTHARKDVPIIIRNDIPSASVDIECLDEPYGVPKVEAKEKGGKKEASHSYK